MSTNSKKDIWDFSLRFITPTVRRYLPDPGDAIAIELGCGDGTRVTAASVLFDTVTGLEHTDFIPADHTQTSVPSNVDMIEMDSTRIPFGEDSVDFVFSFNGLTRFNSLSLFDNTVSEVARVLKPGGVAMLWFGRITRLPFLINPVTIARGYKYCPDSDISLRVSQSRARKSLRRAHLKHVALSTPLHPDTSWRLFRGGRYSYVTAIKSL